MKKRQNCATTRKTLREQLQQITRRMGKLTKKSTKSIVDEEDIANIVAKQTGIPAHPPDRRGNGKSPQNGRDPQSEHHRPRRCPQHRLPSDPPQPSRHQRSKPPDRRIPIPRTYRRWKNATWPACSPSHMFGGEDALIQVDMSEYMEKFADQPHDRIASGLCRL